jgi:hypothetical protein
MTVCVAYVQGYMDGEAFEQCEGGELTEKVFIIAWLVKSFGFKASN